ncbi:MAG: sigma-70 family RNA polymerase sigma factor [Anaerolineales bacterium]|nr:sigma-70 family RNA polymerase sigma factor [Chloroflexota bacterium]MBL6982109.1 sigma-70 family RNA polymerase sigma factor [Anaerolineales bacterium]
MSERTNQEWLDDLQGSNKDEAITDLRDILIRGLQYSLSTHTRGDIELLVEDFAQDALIKILDKLDTFRGESKLTTWAQKIAIRVAYTELRRKRWQDVAMEDLLPEDSGPDFTPAFLTDPQATPEQQINQRMIVETVMQTIEENLTDRQKTAMQAIMGGGMPLEVAAERMGTNRNALYKMIHDARKRLKRELLAKGLSTDDILAAFDSA